MKRLFAIPLLFALLCSSCGISELLPQELASETQDIVEQVRQDNDAVFDEIQRNIDLVTDLKAKVQDAQLEGEAVSLNTVVKDIETIALSYERLASQQDDIRKGVLQKVASLESMRDAVGAEIDLLEQKRADYTEQLRMVDDPDPEIVQTRRKALTKAIEYVDAQIRLWTEFNETEREIVIEMSDIEARIDSFLNMIASSAIVFREGLNLLNLQKDIDEALSLFTSDLPRMEQLTREMEESWSNLDYLLETLIGIANIGIEQ